MHDGRRTTTDANPQQQVTFRSDSRDLKINETRQKQKKRNEKREKDLYNLYLYDYYYVSTCLIYNVNKIYGSAADVDSTGMNRRCTGDVGAVSICMLLVYSLRSRIDCPFVLGFFFSNGYRTLHCIMTCKRYFKPTKNQLLGVTSWQDLPVVPSEHRK